MDWFKTGKGVRQGYMLSPCLFNFYAEYIMENVRLDEAQTGIKTARRNSNNLRYADDTTLMAESKKKPKSLLMKLEEESEKAGLTHIHWVSDAIQPSHPFLQSLSPSGSFLMSWLFASGGWSIGASASASVLPMNIQGWFPLRLTGLISLQSKGLSSIFSNTTTQKYQFFGIQPSLWSSYHSHTWLLEKPLLWLEGPLLAKVCFLICCLSWS